MNEREIINWLEHEENKCLKKGETEKAEAFARVIEFIEQSIKSHNAAMIAKIDRKQTPWL